MGQRTLINGGPVSGGQVNVTVTEVNQRAAEIARAVGLDPAELEELKRETMKLLTPLR